MSAQHDQSIESRPGFWKKLNGWWSGGNGATPVNESSSEAAANRNTKAESSDLPELRLQVLLGLFGDGMAGPLNDSSRQRVLQKLELDDDSRLVVLGAGLGRPAQWLDDQTPGALFAYDDRNEIADMAQAWLSEAKSGVKFDRRDYFETGLKPGFATSIVAFDGFSHIRDKKRLFHHLMQILRPRGRIIFFDFFVTGEDPECPEVAVWSALEERARYPACLGTFSDLVYDIGFDYPDFHDVSDELNAAIRKSFARSVEILKQAGPDAPRLQPHLVAEVDRWNRWLALLESGEARFYQVTVEYFGGSTTV